MGSNKPAASGRGHLSLYRVCFLIYLCAALVGFDGSLMGSINSISYYQEYYGVSENEQASTGIVFAIFNVGQMTGALFAWICTFEQLSTLGFTDANLSTRLQPTGKVVEELSF